jgi:hypothetical protein
MRPRWLAGDAFVFACLIPQPEPSFLVLSVLLSRVLIEPMRTTAIQLWDFVCICSRFSKVYPSHSQTVIATLRHVSPGDEMTDNDYAKDIHGSLPRHCFDCDVLTEALRDMEEQCREAEDDRTREASLAVGKSVDRLLGEEEAYQVKLRELQHRRNCALEVLLKHQSL